MVVGKNLEAQTQNNALKWVDSVFSTLSNEEKITQLMVIRTSAPDGKGGAILYDSKVDSLVKRYNIGGVCLFQGTPQQHATMLNRIQGIAKTPIMVTVDAEWGLGMRFAGIQSFPYQLTMGAMRDGSLAYEVGKAIAMQCRRMKIHVNYAPVIDINNNPNNPVIGVRSFGENKYKVALMGTNIMQGMQDEAVMACAKHFPGHGDVSVDSHFDLPVIQKSMASLDSLELYPFKQLFARGIGSVMIAHLFIPAIDTTANRASSLSYNNITTLMRDKIGYQGLTFTDALEMKGVAKFYPGAEAAVQSLMAGNDMLCLPADVPATIAGVIEAINQGRLSWEIIHSKCKRVLAAKYQWVVGKTEAIDTAHLNIDLNKDVLTLRKAVAKEALTLVKATKGRIVIPSKANDWVVVQTYASGLLADSLKAAGAKIVTIGLDGSDANVKLAALTASKRKKLLVILSHLSRNPANKFGLSNATIAALDQLGSKMETNLLLMGNPYALGFLNTEKVAAVAVGFEDDATFQQNAWEWLRGSFEATGTLPVSIGAFTEGTGILPNEALKQPNAAAATMDPAKLAQIDAIAQMGIDSAAFPGCVVTVLHKGKLAYRKAFGHLSYDASMPMQTNTVFDLASVTKTSATTLAVMKLYEDSLLQLNAPISQYLPWLSGSSKAKLSVRNILLHQAGLVSFIPFYKNVIDTNGIPFPQWFSNTSHAPFTIPVTEALYMHTAYRDSMYQRIKESKVDSIFKYVYSDNDFILLAAVVKSITGLTIDQYMAKTFYKPLQLATTTFEAYRHFTLPQIAPTEQEINFRKGLLWGYVHDPGAAMFGNIAGHAGLFSNATDLAILYQMLLNGGEWQGKRYLNKATIAYFTSYQTPISRRGLGFDKPEKDNGMRPASKAYPAPAVSPLTFGHTGYTGTCVWVDPAKDLVYVFLSNRVHPLGGINTKLADLNIRSQIQEIIFNSILSE